VIGTWQRRFGKIFWQLSAGTRWIALTLKILINGCLLCAVMAGQVVAQENAAPAASSQVADSAINDLPEHALRRFGNWGDASEDNGYYRLVFSPNGQYLAARNRQNRLEIYDVKSGKMLCQVEGDDALINAIDFSPDSQLFLTTSSGNGEKIRIWATANGRLQQEFPVDASVAYFSRDQSKVFALTEQSVETYDIVSANKVGNRQWKDNNRAIALSRDGKLVLVSRMLQNRLHQLQVLDLEAKSSTILDGPTELTKAIQISPNALWIAASYSHRDPRIWLWDLRNPQEEKFILSGHKNAVQSLAFSADGRFLVSTSFDDTAIVWDILTKEMVARFEGHSENVNSSAFSSINLAVATGASGPSDSSILIWDLKSVIFPTRDFPRAFDSFEVVWKELGSNFPDQAFMAMQAIIANKDEWLEKISDKIGIATQTVSQTDILNWIEQLDSPKFKIREEATEKLLAARAAAEPYLQEVLKDPASTEVEYRVTKILRRPAQRPKIRFDELRRLHRSIFAMEMLGTPEAQTVLANIAAGHANIDIAEDASDSLARIKSREEMMEGE
jgi:WD40 repeat protein